MGGLDGKGAFTVSIDVFVKCNVGYLQAHLEE
jgi:hypothetical protein